ncbi:MAG: signal peptidase I [Bacteroidota bacterium]
MDFGAIFYIAIGLIYFFGQAIGRYKLFEKAGKPGWAAFIPGYNHYIWLQLIGKPAWWVALVFIPIASTLVIVAMKIDLARAFGKHKLKEHAAALFLPFYFFPKLGFDEKVKYLGPADQQKNIPKKSGAREWGDAILFAGVSALIIRTFLMEAFMIPTSSMERSLMAGDFLFVSKVHYGARMPQVPLAIPFVHNKIKLGDFTMKSYLDFPQLPYYRTPGFARVQRNDVVVFNYPKHDIEALPDGAGKVKPTSMKENYIKRCVGVPGDVLEVRGGQVYIDGAQGYQPENMQKEFKVLGKPGTQFVTQKRIGKGKDLKGKTTRFVEYTFPQREDLGFRMLKAPIRAFVKEVYNYSDNPNWYINSLENQEFTLFMTDDVAEIIRKNPNVSKVEEVTKPKGQRDGGLYPALYRGVNARAFAEMFPWNIDYYGPLTIPSKGMTIDITDGKNYALYQRVITGYEKHDLERQESNGQVKVLLDGNPITEYTFEMDYYWMMGDNRHNSQDSRFWGFVPEDHIVGKPLFVFMSYESDFGLRLGRIGTKNVK